MRAIIFLLLTFTLHPLSAMDVSKNNTSSILVMKTHDENPLPRTITLKILATYAKDKVPKTTIKTTHFSTDYSKFSFFSDPALVHCITLNIQQAGINYSYTQDVQESDGRTAYFQQMLYAPWGKAARLHYKQDNEYILIYLLADVPSKPDA